MRIQKYSDSEIFDQFSKLMYKRASWATQVLDELTEVGKNLPELLETAGKNIDEFVEELSRQGFAAEEIYKLTNKSAPEIQDLVSGVKNTPIAEPPADPNILTGFRPKPKTTPTPPIPVVPSSLEETTQVIKTEGAEIQEIIQSTTKIETQSLDQVIEMYESLKRSRSSMKGQITKLKNDLAKAKQLSQISVEEIAKKDELILQAERLLKISEDEVLTLSKRITDLGGKVDEAGNIIKNLEQGLDATNQELDLANKAIAELSQKGIQLAEENKQLLSSALEKAELAGYYKALSEAANQTSGPQSISAQVATQVATQSAQQSAQATKQITQATPASTTVITQAAQAATTQGAQKGKKAVQAATAPATGTPNVNPAPAATPTPIPNNVPSANPTTPSTAPSPAITPTSNPTTNPKPTKQNVGNTGTSGTAGATGATGATGAAGAAGTAAVKAKKDSLLKQLILKSTPKLIEKGIGKAIGLGSAGFGLAGGAIFILLKFAGLATMFVGGYLLWRYFFSSDSTAQQKIEDVAGSQYQASEKLKKLKFKEGSKGKILNEDLVNKMNKSLNSYGVLSNPESTEAELEQASKDLDEVDQATQNYLQNKESLRKDLESTEGFEEATSSLGNMISKMAILKQGLLEVAENEQSQIPERGMRTPAGKQAPTENANPEQDHIPQIVKVQDQEIDIGHLSPGMRSSAPSIISKVLNSPEGKAFIDPDNIWGGWLPKTTQTDEKGNLVQNKSKDYLSSLKFLYLNKIFDRQDLRKFIRKNLSRSQRNRMSGWKKAVQHYEGSRNIQANKENNNFFTQNFSKSANLIQSSVIYDNKDILGMNKQADQFSKDYFQDAVVDLEDQYAKSYYAGLKGMYDQKPSNTEADYKKLYEIHGETGSDLIGSAHPLTIDIADAMGKGGVVENLIEQQRQNVGVAKSMPSGNYRARHAWVVQNLVKLADQADEKGLKKASDLIDEALKALLS